MLRVERSCCCMLSLDTCAVGARSSEYWYPVSRARVRVAGGMLLLAEVVGGRCMP